MWNLYTQSIHTDSCTVFSHYNYHIQGGWYDSFKDRKNIHMIYEKCTEDHLALHIFCKKQKFSNQLYN